MANDFCTVSNLSFTYPRQLTPLFRNISFTLPRGWTGVVGANGSGKTTLVRLILGELAPAEGAVRRPGPSCHGVQTANEVPEALHDLVSVPDAEAYRIVEMLHVGYDWPYRWESLSHGERKRAQFGAALYRNPDLLALDEPTNHLDIEATSLIRKALATYQGIGLLISHGRLLLDRLCGRCLFVENGSVTLRPGGVTDGLREGEREEETLLRIRSAARRELAELQREATRRMVQARSADATRSKRHLSRKDSDGRAKINLARVSGKDGVAGKLLRQRDRRLASAHERVADHSATSKPRLGITIGGSASRRDFLFRMEAGRITMGDNLLEVPELIFGSKDRIAILGPNGAGKSTLRRALLPHIVTKRYLDIPQELPPPLAVQLVARLAALSSTARGEVLSTVARLGGIPERLIETETPSPGEARKLMIAVALTSA